jgi:NADH-quinone oxidoreductase subunit M
MNLSLLVVLPFLSGIAILFCSSTRTIRAVAFTASILQIIAAAFLIYAYMQARAAGNTSAMLFEYTHAWFASLNIQYHIGVDGISIAMIALTALVVQAGILLSWQQERMTKEFFFLLFLLSAGAYGFFISLDLFTLFFFLELAVVPKFLLIGIWGSGKKEYSAMKIALMLMAGSALVFVGLLGV